MEDIKPDDKLEAAARGYAQKVCDHNNKNEAYIFNDILQYSLTDFKAGAAWKEKEIERKKKQTSWKKLGIW